MNGGLKLRVLELHHERCFLCGKKQSTKERLQVHHILPRSQGGKDLLINLLPLCDECHKEVHAKAFLLKTLQRHLKAQLERIIDKNFLYSVKEIALILSTEPKTIKDFIRNNDKSFTHKNNSQYIKGADLINGLLGIGYKVDENYAKRHKKNMTKYNRAVTH